MFTSLLGYFILIAFAWLCSNSRRHINWKTVSGAVAIQFGFGALVLYSPWGKLGLEVLSIIVNEVIALGFSGIDFLFGGLSKTDHLGFIFAFQVLPVIVFFSSLISVLYFLNVMPVVIKLLGGSIQKLLGTSHAESLSATANIFVGQTEAPLCIKPCLARMTHSELFAVMVGGLTSISSSVMAGYAQIGISLEYLLAACFMAAPSGLLFAKLLIPEIEAIDTSESAEADVNNPVNLFDAAAQGASDGLKLALNVGAILIAFIGLIAVANGLLGTLGGYIGQENFRIEGILGILFSPLAWLLGIPWGEVAAAGSLIGKKLVLNEFVAYLELIELGNALSLRSQAIMTFALCGFANFSSIAILLGGLGTLIPGRRDEIAKLGLRALMAASLANFSSAAIAGVLIKI